MRKQITNRFRPPTTRIVPPKLRLHSAIAQASFLTTILSGEDTIVELDDTVLENQKSGTGQGNARKLSGSRSRIRVSPFTRYDHQHQVPADEVVVTTTTLVSVPFVDTAQVTYHATEPDIEAYVRSGEPMVRISNGGQFVGGLTEISYRHGDRSMHKIY
jgi:hypothetical protein